MHSRLSELPVAIAMCGMWPCVLLRGSRVVDGSSAVTAHATKHCLARGLDYCFLYTDLSNPTSNKIYVNIGYEFVCDSADYAFD